MHITTCDTELAKEKVLTGNEYISYNRDEMSIRNNQKLMDLIKIIERKGIKFDNMKSISFLSSNIHKLSQFNELVKNDTLLSKLVKFINIETRSIDFDEAPEELEDSFVENAIAKSEFYSAKTGLSVLSEDSGFVVPIANFTPGVVSARFSDTEIGITGYNSVMHRIKAVFGQEKFDYCFDKSNESIHFKNNLSTIGTVSEKLMELRRAYNLVRGDILSRNGVMAYFITSASITSNNNTVEESCTLTGKFNTEVCDSLYGCNDGFLLGDLEVFNDFLNSSSQMFGYNPLFDTMSANRSSTHDVMTHRRNAITSVLIKILESYVVHYKN